MGSPDVATGDNELVLHVSKYRFEGRQLIDPAPDVAIYSRTQREFKPARAETYHVGKDTLELIGIQYVDGTGSKDLTLDELRHETGKAIRIVFDEVQSGD